MKILFMTADKYPPFRPAAKYIFGRELVSRGVCIDWLIQSEGSQVGSRTIECSGGKIYLARSNNRENRLSKVLKHAADVVNDLKVLILVFRRKYDIVQVKDKYFGALIGALAAALSGAKFSYWIAYPHSEATLSQARLGYAKFRYFSYVKGYVYGVCLYGLISRFAHIIFVQSEQMKIDMANRGVPLEKMVAIPGSVDIDEIQLYLQKLENSAYPRNKQVLYVGTLMRIRRLDMLLDAFVLVLKEHPDAELCFLGKGEHVKDEEMLMQKAIENGIRDSVRFLGNQSFKTVIRHVSESAVCLSPYYPSFILNSTSPTKLLEYMVVARPVVGNMHPEQSEIIGESGCGECVEWDASAFAEAITNLLNDPKHAADCGIRGKRYVETHRTHKLLSDRVFDSYKQLLLS